MLEKGSWAPSGTSDEAHPPTPFAPEVPWKGHTREEGGTDKGVASVKANASKVKSIVKLRDV